MINTDRDCQQTLPLPPEAIKVTVIIVCLIRVYIYGVYSKLVGYT